MSEILERFYSALWGVSDEYRSIWYGEKNKEPTLRQWFRNTDQAILFTKALDKNKYNIYHACSLFSTKRRKQQYAAKIKSLWIDLDLKHTTFSSLKEVLLQLKNLENTPFANNYWVIFTGHGFHVYWIFDNYFTHEEWKSAATYLFNTLKEKGIQFDPARVRDSASILRVIGTYNLKDTPLEIKLLKEGELLSKATIPLTYVAPTPAAVQKTNYTKEDFNLSTELASLSYLKSDVNLVIKKCDVMRDFSATGFAGNEPAWYAALALIRHCVDGTEYAHQYSANDKTYNEEQTNKKLAQLEEKDIGPTLCERFVAMGFCSNCPFKDKVKSPIQLGAIVTPLENVAEELPAKNKVDRAKELIELAPKDGWIVGKEGVYRIVDEVPVLITLSPFYIIDLICEDSNDLTVVAAVIRYYLNGRPHTFKLPLKLLADDKKLLAEFTSRRLFPVNKKHLKDYIATYAINLSHVEPQKAVTSLGWQDDGSFLYSVSGDAWNKKGEYVSYVLDKKLVSYAKGLTQKGTLAAWKDAVAQFCSDPVYYPHLFSLLCSFGSILLPFTNAKGILLSLQGIGGSGKTLAHKLALSVWGCLDDAGVQSTSDSSIARLGRFAALKNIPLRMDEITALKARELEGFVFAIVNGRGRSRATTDGSLSNTAANWQTVTFVTTNRPMMETNVDIITEAERCRILELAVNMPDNIVSVGQIAGKIIEQNYGVAGKEFAKWVVMNTEAAQVYIDKFQIKFQSMVESDKRFWVACGAIAFTAGVILKKLGLLDLNYDALVTYFIGILKTQGAKNTQDITASRGFETAEELAHALNDHLAGNVAKLDMDMNVIYSPEREIKARLVTNHLTGESTLYVKLQPVKEFINMYFTESYKAVLRRFEIADDKPQRFKSVVMRCYEFKLSTKKGDL
jgi:hypothetical protein